MFPWLIPVLICASFKEVNSLINSKFFVNCITFVVVSFFEYFSMLLSLLLYLHKKLFADLSCKLQHSIILSVCIG